MTPRPDRTLIELAFFAGEHPAIVALRHKTSIKSVKEIWRRAREANRLPKIARKIGKGRRG
jgi:hypothetical protein